MPPEQPPWERKEYPFKDPRKYDRGDALAGYGGGGSSSAPRWRDPYHAPRDLPRGSPRRPLSGQYRQGGGYHQFYPEDSTGHGGTPSRSDRFWTEGDGFRPSSFRYSSGGRGNSGGCSRENRGSFRRSIYWDYGDFSRQHHQEPHANPSQRAVTAPISSTSQFPPKDKDEKIGGIDDGFGAGHRFDHRDHTLGIVPWKKWTRPASTKTGRSELEGSGLEVGLPVMKETPILSPVICPLPPDEGTPRNKPRLGWGQGLAKYEKQKVEGSTEHSTGGGSAVLSDNSQKAMGTSGCLSPSTPCSITCSSSPGTEDKPCSRIIHNDFGVSQNNGIPGITSQPMYMEVSINFDGWEVNPATLDAWLVELLQSEDSFSGDSLMRQSVMNKLLRLKGDVANGLERIENKIDLLEKELKLLHSDAKDGACQGFLESVDNSTIQLHEQPSNGLPSVSTNLKDQMMKYMEVTCIKERASSISLVENVTVEDNDIVHSETVSCEISASSAVPKKYSDSCTEEFLVNASSLEDDRLWATEFENNVDSHRMGRLMIASGDEVGTHIAGDSSSVDRHCGGTTQGKTTSNLITLFMDSNNITGKHVSELYGTTALSRNLPESNIWGKIDFTLCRKNDLKIKEKLATNKRQLKFKEQVLALKFRALHHLWKEDLRLLSTRKLRANSSKRCESNSLLLNGSQKQRSSIRSRFTLHAGNLTLVPTTEIMSFTSKLLSDSQIKLCRNSLKMPALLLEERERRYSRFVTHNGLIEDPRSFEMERTTINPWSQDEQEIFMEMLARYGKDFIMISSFLDHKTTADCIEFYYKNHKSESFKEVKKWLDLRKQKQCPPTNTYLVGSGKNGKYEISTALDILDAAKVVEAPSHGAARIEKNTGSTTYCTANAVKVFNMSPAYLEGANDVTMSGQERESVAAEVLAGIRGALSSEAMNSSITSSIDHAEVKCATRGQLMTWNLEEEDACSDEDCGELDSTDWTDEEKSKFIHALCIHGKDFSSISNYIRTRSREQCKIFFSKARKCLALDAINPGCVNEVMPVSITNGGRSHTDDASGAEMDSATCSTQSCYKMDVDGSQFLANTNYEVNAHAPTHDCTEMVRSNEHIDSEFVRANLVDGEEKVDEKQASVPLDEKLLSKEVNLQFDIRAMEGIAAASECIEAEQLCVAVDAAERETGVVSIISQAESNVTFRNTEPLRECLEEESKELTCRMIPNASIDGNFPMNSVKKDDDSNLPELAEVRLSNTKILNVNSTENSNGLCSSALDFNGGEATLTSGEKANGYQRLNFNPNYQQQMQRDLLSCPRKKPMAVSLKQENDCCVSSNSILRDACNMCTVGSSNILLETNSKFEKPESKSHQNVLGKRELCQQYMLRNVPVNQVDLNIQILRGYPPTLKQDFKREVDPPPGVNPSLLDMELKKNGVSLPNHLFASDAHWNQSNASNFPVSASGILSQVKRENKSEVELRTCFKNASSEFKEHNTGDVKLFGKILCHTSSQKSSSSSHGNNLRLASPKLDGTPTLNCASDAKSGDQVVSGAGVGQACLEDLPVTYGFWDGKRVQTGFSSLPETAAVLAKYQGSMAGPFFSEKDSPPGCTGILTDYQKPCTDTKLVGDISQLPKRNGIEIIPGFQQQRRATPVGVNIVGRGIFAGGGMLSDPVAALKMHYAARTNVLGNDMEPWKGDVGGR